MAIIYDISSGDIIPENSGITTVPGHTGRPEAQTALQEVTTGRQQIAESMSCTEYMALFREILKDL